MNAAKSYGIVVLICIFGSTGLTSCATENQEIASGGMTLSEQDTERMAWFREAKYGLFIHWGPYSALAGEWNNRQVPTDQIAEWIMHHLEIPVEEYRELARDFHPVDFDAEAWVQLAVDAGMKYVVITSKHHDGFAMYDSEVSDYNIVDWTPFGRDPIRELAEACARHGLKFGMYYSQREDWDEAHAYGNTWDFDFVPEENLEVFEQDYLYRKAEPQVREILTGYGPLGLIWFDRGLYTQEQAWRFADLVHTLQPNCLVNGRVGSYNQELAGDYQSLSDNGMPIGGIEEYWESPGTLNDTWGYSKFDTNWKSPAEVVERLVRIVSAGGNYLLNVGPTGSGIIPQASVDILREVGQWTKSNGEGIYGAEAGPFAPLAWGYVSRKGNSLYAFVTTWPEDNTILLPGLQTEIQDVGLLTEPDRQVSWSKTGDDVEIDLRDISQDPLATALKIHLTGDVEVLPVVTGPASDGSITLDYIAAVTQAGAVKRFNRKGGFHIGGLKQPGDGIEWHIHPDVSGRFSTSITYATREMWPSESLELELGGHTQGVPIELTGDWYEFATVDAGQVSLESGTPEVLSLHLRVPAEDRLLYIREVTLRPVAP